MVRGEDTVVAVAVLPWRRDKISETIEELERREVDDAVLSRATTVASPVAVRAADAFPSAVADLSLGG